MSISIHAPRKGSDGRTSARRTSAKHFNPRSPQGERHTSSWLHKCQNGHFNPRSPQGERRSQSLQTGLQAIFQSTLPARGATANQFHRVEECISIHAPRKGSDRVNVGNHPVPKDFNPRSPQGERPQVTVSVDAIPRFQSTLPARGATSCR